MNLLNKELKKRLVNTFSQYEKKIKQLELESNSLRDIINSLMINPLSLNPKFKEISSQFREQLYSELDLPSLMEKMGVLADALSITQQEDKKNQQSIVELLIKSVELIQCISDVPKDKQRIEQFRSALSSLSQDKETPLPMSELVADYVTPVITELDQLKMINSDRTDAEINQEISIKVNHGLYQLINHLSIPQELDVKKENIKLSLENKMTGEELIRVLDEMTNMVIDAFNVEQNRVKKFLQQLIDQLHDFDSYLNSSSEVQQWAAATRSELESGIKDNIEQIKLHLDSSKSIEELTEKVSQNFVKINNRLKEYHEIEKKREREYEKLVQGLKEKLSESEKIAEEVKNLLSFQKYKINHDSLTGLPNRESYEEHIHEAVLRWHRSSKELSVAIADIDYFKQINDNYGHHAGDKVLKKIAILFKESIRAVDFVSRIGGEEFVFIFEQTDSQSALLVLEKLRQLVEEYDFYYKDEKVIVTVSFGLTTIKKNDDIESLFIRADKALYNAKAQGRNRISIL